MEKRERAKKEVTDKIKYEPINIRAEKVLGLTIKDFIEENTPHTQIEFFERYTPVIMMAIDREKYLKLLKKNIEGQHKEIDTQLKTILKLTEIMDFYDSETDKFITHDGEKISAEKIIASGYKIKDKKLYIGR